MEDEDETNLFGVDTSHDGMPVLALARGVMVHSELLRDQMHDPPLLRAERPRERELVPHRVILEQQDPRINLQRRRIVQIELVRRALHAAGRTRRHRVHRLLQLRRRRVRLHAVLVGHRHRRRRRVLLRTTIRRRIARGERTLWDERGRPRGHDRPKVVVRRAYSLLLGELEALLLELLRGRLLLELFLLELHGAHTTDRLFALDPLLFALLEDFFVFDAQLAALDVEAVQSGDDGVGVGRLPEVGEGEAAEGARLVEVVVERVGGWDGEGDLGNKTMY